MNLSNLTKTTTKSAKRLGRGLSSGKGKTAGRGTKGQKSRSGYNIPRRFEGGQTSLIARLPKARGFNSRYDKPQTLRIERVEAKYNNGETVNLKSLQEKGLIKSADITVKLVGAKLTKELKFSQVKLNQKLLAAYQANLQAAQSKPKTTKAQASKPKTSTTRAAKAASEKKARAKKPTAK